MKSLLLAGLVGIAISAKAQAADAAAPQISSTDQSVVAPIPAAPAPAAPAAATPAAAAPVAPAPVAATPAAPAETPAPAPTETAPAMPAVATTPDVQLTPVTPAATPETTPAATEPAKAEPAAPATDSAAAPANEATAPQAEAAKPVEKKRIKRKRPKGQDYPKNPMFEMLGQTKASEPLGYPNAENPTIKPAMEMAPAAMPSPPMTGDPVQKTPENTNSSTYTPPTKDGKTITYITGGIGDDERKALETVKKDYNLQITNSGANGEFVGKSHLTIQNANGLEVLSVDAGPMFYAQVPAGTYTISNGTSKKQVNLTAENPTVIRFESK